jgi:Icc-related predicted phosphoesterase/uncharacterized protein YprB with RNaseH-like and TPR domain
MNILAFSDWRVQDVQNAIDLVKSVGEPVDVIVYAGDDLTRFEAPARSYFSELAGLCKAGVLLAVAGNDDGPEQKAILAKGNVRDLYECPFVYRDTVFVGVEGATSGPGYLLHAESTITKRLAHLRASVDARQVVVVSHPPPFGILDEGIRFAGLAEDGHHTGSKALRGFVEADPAVRLVICGHCHSHGGLNERLGEALVVNVASHDGESSVGRMALINFDDSSVVPPVDWLLTTDLIPPDSVRNLRGVGPKREPALRNAGLQTIYQLASCQDLLQIAQACGLGYKRMKKLQFEAQSHLSNRIIPIAPFNLNLAETMFFDIETDIAMQRVWLVGVLWRNVFRQFYSDKWAEEKNMLKQFLDFLARNTPSVLVSYSTKSFDRGVLAKALRRCKLNGRRFNNTPHTDMGTEIVRCFALPIKSRAVKEVGRFFGYQFKHSELNGFQVALEYSRHIEEARPLNGSVLEYNEDDVRVLEHIVHRLTRAGEETAAQRAI